MTSKFVDIPIPPLVVEVEKWQLCFFAKAVGETNPIYFDEAAARAAGHPSILAPPTYAVTLSLCETDPYSRYRALGIDWCTMLHAQQRFDYFAPIHAGDCIRFQSRIVDFIQRRQGKLKFLIEETEAFNQREELTTRFRKTIVIRGTGAAE